MSLQGFYLLPHPPIVVPEVGKGEEERIRDTGNSLHTVGKEIAEKSPNVIILVTPHGTMFQDAIALADADEIYGDLKSFGVPNVSMRSPIHKGLTSRIFELAYHKGISVVMATNSLLDQYHTSLFLDHGALVPLYFINQYYNKYQLVHITYAALSDIELYKLGIEINNAVQELKEDAILIASGDLSHKLKEEGPYGHHPSGEKFDAAFLDHLQRGDVVGVLSMDEEMICHAGECGRRSVAILLGALEGKEFSGDLLSYEGTFGVGYGVMRFDVLSEDAPTLEKLEELRSATYEKRKYESDPHVRLARESLTTYLDCEEVLKELPDYVTEEMTNTKRGVFVSLKMHGELRGCIGTVFPTTNNIAEEIIRNAIEAGLNDPRFYEVEEKELMDIVFSVDVLTEPEYVSKEALSPKEYGVIVSSKGKTGLLLPDLEGVDTVEEQLSIALEKAGIKSSQMYKIQRFKVIRHKEN
ncbi:Extradiol ring-cleavage dioxygenase, class III protein, subunit B [Alkaliphilus metalliredigens QYMF]|uniref:Extradiol ring-cleavage dioxygenase, class III protein, subunit B n=1 Tax=Alkaliphilus metalliredigens (strain QYMF) TaxID=293826 RepID=A6TQ64_ALKMQ|nr:AmmeMemoRadiSam system protein A [Alkaliphilus metalliredigens]ABR48332.1 Extradiol ring-cleavage dioxygenase, class III protein, subunit B [Alkaliphilus metalliredigens QYMF]